MNDPATHTVGRPCCPLCTSEGPVLHANLRDRLCDLPGTWSIRRCPNPACRLLWLDPMPLPEDLPSLYANYYTHQIERPKRRTIAHLAYRCLLTISGLARQRTGLRLFLLANRTPARLLEVGCGSGERLAQLRALGWSVEGQEIDPAAAESARRRGLPIHLGQLHELSLPANCYDAVVTNHVLEHVPEPLLLLRECCRVLKSGGYFALITPNSESFGHRRFGAAWLSLDPPRHLHLFNARTLRQLAEQAGLRDCRVYTSAANAQFVAEGSLAIARTGKHHFGRRPDPGIVFSSLIFQLQALVVLRREPFSGEECILTATK
ncbi:MAG: class I SAM-dependent methyltransferase [Verrucomicrobiae bacterium]|nr:class I SAM-dependent methyltransferase [Verrucomicrobiae bacterium]